MRAPSLSLVIALLAVTPAVSGAQSLLDASARGAPQYASYRLDSPIGRRIEQMALPLAIVLPLSRRIALDIASAWASSEVTGADGESRVSGLTDTQVRAMWTIGSDALVLTAGLNLPTGRSTVDSSQIDAAGLVGNDFLAFPVSNMGTGFGATGGMAVARPLGEWNVGAGASFRVSSSYEPFELGGERARYEPGNEYRLRLGGDRRLLGGRLALGATLAMFGDDAAGGSTYATGDRYVLQGAWSGAVRSLEVTVSGWNLTRGEGETIGGVAPWENISNVAISMGMDLGGARVEPNVELRTWMRDAGDRASGLHRGDNVGRLAALGIRAQSRLGRLLLTPSAAYSVGGVQTAVGRASLTGLRLTLGARLER